MTEQSEQFENLYQYYDYIRKFGINIEIYHLVSKGQYPSKESKADLDRKVKFAWIFKILNLMNNAIQFLKEYDTRLHHQQLAIWNDTVTFQKFINEEIRESIQEYSLWSNLDIQSFQEIYQQSTLNAGLLKLFQESAEKTIKSRGVGVHGSLLGPQARH